MKTLNRRGFLGAGVALAAGTLVLPRALHAAPVAPLIPPASPDLRSVVASILDRPNAEWHRDRRPDCSCGRCRALRHAIWTCGSCGYEGEWLVEPCDCQEVRNENIPWLRERIAAIEAGRPVDGYSMESLPHMQRDLAKFLARPDAPCRAHYDAHTRARIRDTSYQCGHGDLSCPTCGATIVGPTPMDGEYLAETIRQLREALA